jgi:hypothetical protein
MGEHKRRIEDKDGQMIKEGFVYVRRQDRG